MSFGTILRESREQKRLDLTVVARRLRIRPDILEAIEDAEAAQLVDLITARVLAVKEDL